eukprot:159364_1
MNLKLSAIILLGSITLVFCRLSTGDVLETLTRVDILSKRRIFLQYVTQCTTETQQLIKDEPCAALVNPDAGSVGEAVAFTENQCGACNIANFRARVNEAMEVCNREQASDKLLTALAGLVAVHDRICENPECIASITFAVSGDNFLDMDTTQFVCSRCESESYGNCTDPRIKAVCLKGSRDDSSTCLQQLSSRQFCASTCPTMLDRFSRQIRRVRGCKRSSTVGAILHASDFPKLCTP